MSEQTAQRETARKIAERLYTILVTDSKRTIKEDWAEALELVLAAEAEKRRNEGWQQGYSASEATYGLVRERIASLTADLAQAQQERDAAQKAMAYSSEQAHLEWTRANKAEGDLSAAEQARDEARKEIERILTKYGAQAIEANARAQSAARTALLEAAEEARCRHADNEGVYPTWHQIAVWLTTRAGGGKA